MTKRTDKDYVRGLTLLKASSTNYNDSSPNRAILECFDNRFPHRDYWVTFTCPEFTTRCPVTDQPDFGKITINYIPDKKCIESKSLKLYLVSYRNYAAFQEELVNRILEDVVATCAPRQITVEGEFNPRGGIGIRITAMHPLQ